MSRVQFWKYVHVSAETQRPCVATSLCRTLSDCLSGRVITMRCEHNYFLWLTLARPANANMTEQPQNRSTFTMTRTDHARKLCLI